MKKVSRRRFLETAIMGTCFAKTESLWADRKICLLPFSTDSVPIGKTGVMVSRIAQGTGTNGINRVSDQTCLGMRGFVKLARYACERGIRFFDLADSYGSHPYFRNALKEIPREEIVISTQLWFQGRGSMVKIDTALPHIERFRQEIGVDVLDLVSIQSVRDFHWPEQVKRIRDELSILKEKGTVRAVGCSCQSRDAFRMAVDDPWVDVIFACITHRQTDRDVTPNDESPLFKKARANGKFVVGMSIFGGGLLTRTDERDSSLRYVFGQGLVDAVSIGFTHPEEIDDTMERVNEIV